MTCSRCGGLMRQERVARLLALWACFACGHRTDETMYFNRQMMREESRGERHERLMRELLHELALMGAHQ